MEQHVKQLQIIEMNNVLNEPATEKLNKITKENHVQSEKVDMEILYREQLNHMIERDKLQLRCMKQPIADKKDDIQ